MCRVPARHPCLPTENYKAVGARADQLSLKPFSSFFPLMNTVNMLLLLEPTGMLGLCWTVFVCLLLFCLHIYLIDRATEQSEHSFGIVQLLCAPKLQIVTFTAIQEPVRPASWLARVESSPGEGELRSVGPSRLVEEDGWRVEWDILSLKG